jgi:hypothetical protein
MGGRKYFYHRVTEGTEKDGKRGLGRVTDLIDRLIMIEGEWIEA